VATTPRKIKIAPYIYTVQEVPKLPDAGSCETDYETITVSGNQTDTQKADTLLHESLHGVFNQGLGDQLKELDKGLEETLCAFLAPRLLAIIRDNPGLIEFLKEAK